MCIRDSYTIEVASSAGLGTYSLKGALNASYESSAPNDSIATAQSLASTFIVPRFGFDRGGVIGSVEANGSDYFSFTLPSGSSMSAVLAAASSIGLQIYNPNGDLMISG